MFVCMSDDRIRLYQGRNRIRLKTFVGSSQRCKHKHDECTQRRLHSKYHVNITLTGNVFLEWRVQIPSYHICNMIKRHFTIWEQNAESVQACENVFSSGWSTSLVYWSTSASIKQPHHIWLRCASTSQQPTTDVTSALQRTATWQFHKSDWQDTVEEVSLYLVRCCGTHYHWLFVMYHWHWLSSAHNWRLFCFPEHTGHHSS